MNPVNLRVAAVAKTCVDSAIAFDGVRLELGQRCIIDGLSFAVAPGEFACVVGPSGCGKTTLLRLVSGLLSPNGGEVSRAARHFAEPSAQIILS